MFWVIGNGWPRRQLAVSILPVRPGYSNTNLLTKDRARPRDLPFRYPCHTGHVNQPQKFSFIANPGWIQNPITWGDNGRRRTFETCLDRLPTQQQNIAVLDCADTRSSGVRWDALGMLEGRCMFCFVKSNSRNKNRHGLCNACVCNCM